MEKRENLFWYLEALVYAVIGVALLITFVARIIVVDGSSMNPTLTDKDVVITATPYTKLKQGDIVVVNSEVYGKNLVKRVIAVENQTVCIDSATGNVYVDDVLVEENYIAEKIDSMHVGPLEYPYTVPEGCVFLLGDNRNKSSDSRVFGAVETHCVIGRVFFRIAPLSQLGTVK